MAIRFEIKTVTPRMAKAWLKKNIEINRPPKKAKIPMYARDMLAGNWQVTGEAIKFDTDGRLIDGQNRLLAVVAADVAVDFAVMYDVPATAFAVLDSGSARTAADSNAMLPLTSAVVRWVIMWDRGHHTGSGTYKPTSSEIGERYRAETKEFDLVAPRARDCQTFGLGTGSAAGTAFYLFARIDYEQAAGFFDQYISGANLSPNSPILRLANRIRRTQDRLTRTEQLSLFIRAWNFYRVDQPLVSPLGLTGVKITDENFPQPK